MTTADGLLGAARGLRDVIRAAAGEIESGRCLPTRIVERLTEMGVFRAGVPASLGGLEIPLAEQLRTFEELGRADGSVGWCAMIGALTSLVSGSLAPEEARDIFGDPSVRAGGVYAPSGRAEPDGDSFKLSGRWAFGSGVTHSDWFALGAVVFDGEAPQMDGDRPDLRFMIVPVSSLDVEDTWHVSGLRGTGSNHVAANAVVVPSSRTFPLIGARPRQPGPLFRFPLLGGLALGVCSVALGIARDALDELDTLASAKTPTGARRTLARRPLVQMERASAEAELRAARGLVFDTVDEAWERAEAGEDPSIELRTSLRLAATHAARTSARVVDRAYDAGGGSSIFDESRLQRAFRDVHAITQHLVVGTSTLELVGRLLLGVETDVSQL